MATTKVPCGDSGETRKKELEVKIHMEPPRGEYARISTRPPPLQPPLGTSQATRERWTVTSQETRDRRRPTRGCAHVHGHMYNCHLAPGTSQTTLLDRIPKQRPPVSDQATVSQPGGTPNWRCSTGVSTRPRPSAMSRVLPPHLSCPLMIEMSVIIETPKWSAALLRPASHPSFPFLGPS